MVSFGEALAAGKITPQEAFDIFDSLPLVKPSELIGLWKGVSFPIGDPMDQSLERSGWFGKEFIDENNVHPLVFNSTNGGRFAADPEKSMMLALVGQDVYIPDKQPEVETDQCKARLRVVEYRGVATASMVYNNLPIIDSFRKVDNNTVLGSMENPQMPAPYFFVLRRHA